MRAAPPPPQFRTRSWERRIRRQRKRRVVLYSSMAVFLVVTVTTVTAVFFFRTGTQGPPTPRAAADQMLRSMGKNSINEFEQSLCEPKRNQAGGILREFNSGLVDFGQQLNDLTWHVTKETDVAEGEVDLDLDVTLVTYEKSSGKTDRRPLPMRLQALKDNGWYICNIEFLTL